MACVRKRRGRWVVDYRDNRGQRHWETCGTRKEADQLLARRLDELGRGAYTAPRENRRFDDVAAAFTAAHIKTRVRATTARDYETNLRLHLAPYFQGWKLLAITPYVVDNFLCALSERGVGQRTTNKCLTLLKQMLSHAVRLRWIHENPARWTKKIPEVAAFNRGSVDDNILTPEEIRRLLDTATDRWRLLILAAVLTGMRQGELLGLRWGDIDWNSKQIYVRRQYTAGRFSCLKTPAGRRQITIPSNLTRELHAWRLACPPGAQDLVFPNGAGNPESHANVLQRGFYPALRRAGLRRIRFHDLRHTFASLLIANREDPKRIQRLMGHSSIQVTFDVYGHLFPDGEDGVANRLESTVLGEVGSKTVATQVRTTKRRPTRLVQVTEKSGGVLVARGGIEPPTRGFSVHCSTD